MNRLLTISHNSLIINDLQCEQAVRNMLVILFIFVRDNQGGVCDTIDMKEKVNNEQSHTGTHCHTAVTHCDSLTQESNMHHKMDKGTLTREAIQSLVKRFGFKPAKAQIVLLEASKARILFAIGTHTYTLDRECGVVAEMR